MKFRQKPVVIDAELYEDTKESLARVLSLGNGIGIMPNRSLTIRVPEGTIKADIGDWIIKGVTGELYPCKLGTFEQTYERVEE